MSKSTYCYIRSASIRKLIKQNGKRCGADFLSAMDKLVQEKVERCCSLFNGHHSTLDGTLVNLVK